MGAKKQVRMSNKAVKGRYSLTAEEQRFIMLVISQIQPNDEDFKDYKLHISDIAEACEVEKKHSRFRSFAKKLLGRVIQIEDDNEILAMNWFSHLSYTKGTGVIECSISPKLKPYLLKLQNKYTSANLEYLLKFKSKYASRLYLVLKSDFGAQYSPLLEVKYSIDEMITKFELAEAYKKRFSDFRTRFLEPSINEINEITELNIDFEEIKPSRKIEGIKFTVEKKQTLEVKDDALTHQTQAFDDIALTLDTQAIKQPVETTESVLKAQTRLDQKAISYIVSWGVEVRYIKKVLRYMQTMELGQIVYEMTMGNYDALNNKKAVFIAKCEDYIANKKEDNGYATI